MFLRMQKIYLPESATKSIVLRFCLSNADLSWSREKLGPGRFWLARSKLAFKLSLLPRGTFQSGPWA